MSTPPPSQPFARPLSAPSLGRPATRRVRAGFIPLIDAAVLIAAAEMGFAEREGVTLDLVRDVSWANIRDRLAFRQFDVAHMLSPMPVAAQLGLGMNAFPTVAPMALGLGGNAITLSTALFRQIEAGLEAPAPEGSPAYAAGLRRVVEARRQAGAPPLVFAVVYPFSSHNYEFRFWMGQGGVDPDRDVTMTVVPPPLMADALASGSIDGFCVNAPWNMLAVESGVGRIVAVKADIWPASPEKVLGMRPDWIEANRDTALRLVVALEAAARWCDAPDNRADLSALMAEPRHLGTSADVVQRLLAGRIAIDPAGLERSIPGYLAFHRGAATFPWISQGLWVYSQMLRWGQAERRAGDEARVRAAFRCDLYREALGSADLPLHDERVEGALDAPADEPSTGAPITMPPDRFADGVPFDPAEIDAYVAHFDIRRRDGAEGAGTPD